MLRDPSLVPLSRQHQHALALCVRIRRALEAGNAGVNAWSTEVRDAFAREIGVHFAAEEALVFPEARQFASLAPLVDDLLSDHAALRDYFQRAEAGTLDAAALADFALRLDDHIRKEERQLFEQMQDQVPRDRMDKLGAALQRYLEEHGTGAACRISP